MSIVNSSSKKKLLVLAGPTASGKTKTAIRWSQALGDAPIVNADSRQFYQEMSIGTAKPTPEELAQAPHYLFDDRSIHSPFDVGDYEREALALLSQLFEKHDQVILTGGSGLYIRALCEGLDEFPEVTKSAKEKVADIFEKEGLLGLQAALAQLDPETYNKIDLQNPRRLVRALEVCYIEGQPYSAYLKKPKKERPFLHVYYCLEWERPTLYDRINRRVDLMIEAGLEAEAKRLYPQRDLRALQTVGYREFFSYFSDENITLNETIEMIKQNTRRYAKRQITWFKNLPDCVYFHPEDWEIGLKSFRSE